MNYAKGGEEREKDILDNGNSMCKGPVVSGSMHLKKGKVTSKVSLASRVESADLGLPRKAEARLHWVLFCFVLFFNDSGFIF